jgi:hypothetical protein
MRLLENRDVVVQHHGRGIVVVGMGAASCPTADTAHIPSMNRLVMNAL